MSHLKKKELHVENGCLNYWVHASVRGVCVSVDVCAYKGILEHVDM